MRTIAHISDLHFGRIEPATLPALRNALEDLQPDVLAVSGDITQRARRHEFIAARDYLKTLPGEPIIVPGNHDVPLFNVFARWLSPLAHYRRYISDDLQPGYTDREVAVLGVNTARSLTWKDGRINKQQVETACERFRGTGDALRVLVAHHPFDTEDAARSRNIVGRADMAMMHFASCKVDVILTGHLHAGGTSASGLRYKGLGHSTLFVQAGTATSRRTRGAPNMWNLLRVNGRNLTVESWSWVAAEERFTMSGADIFQSGPDGWARSQNA